MIIRDVPGKLDLLFAVRGSIVPVIAPRIAFLMLVATAMVILHRQLGLFPSVDAFGFTIFGIALSLFLGFRNNAAYDRWWEARKLWGGLLADLRSLAREAEIFVRDPQVRHQILKSGLAFLHLHRRNLRAIENGGAEAGISRELLEAQHPPCAALDQIAALVSKARLENSIDAFGSQILSKRLGSLALQQAGCERIVSTPLPYVYSLLIYRTTYLYCLLLPLALLERAGNMTPVFVGIVGYMFLGLAEVSEELSHPFGTTPNALPLDAICRTAEISLAPHLGQKAPEPLAATDYYLS